MASKSTASYKELLRVVVQQCAAVGSQPHPDVVVTDFELAAMTAVREVLGDSVRCQGCFYHLTQSTWRKIQELGLVGMYNENDSFRLFAGMLDGLAFLPADRTAEGMAYLRTIMPPAATQLVDYFDVTYVNGCISVDQNDVVHRQPARFPATSWSIHDATVTGGDRTNNFAEGWNNRLQSFTGHQHPTIWRLIEGLQADAAEASSRILRHAVGNLSPKRQNRGTKAHQVRLQRLCADLAQGRRSVADFIRAIGHCVRHITV
jgi:hypothetical protein